MKDVGGGQLQKEKYLYQLLSLLFLPDTES